MTVERWNISTDLSMDIWSVLKVSHVYFRHFGFCFGTFRPVSKEGFLAGLATREDGIDGSGQWCFGWDLAIDFQRAQGDVCVPSRGYLDGPLDIDFGPRSRKHGVVSFSSESFCAYDPPW